MAQPQPNSQRNTFVLCFDGTGNKFSGTESDSNILKIYRMLDRTQGNTFHYYQPGIGTYVTSTSLDHTSMATRLKSWYDKQLDAAIGTSLGTHVMGGYLFLMRYYNPGDDIYFFGFSRGAYTARFLAEMLDHVGLLSAGNEELTRFAWKTFAKWQARRGGDPQKERDMYDFMANFRETFSRPIRRIRFLGLFDTVNSVPKFEAAWLQRSKFPYTAQTSAKVIRHAVSIDERRAKFRQDLITSGQLRTQERERPYLRHYQDRSHSSHDLVSSDLQGNIHEGNPSIFPWVHSSAGPSASSTVGPPPPNHQPAPAIPPKTEHLRGYSTYHRAQDISEVWFPGQHGDIGGGWSKARGELWMASHIPLVWMVTEAARAGLRFDLTKMAGLTCSADGIDEYGHPDHEHYLKFHKAIHESALHGFLHDCLEFGGGIPATSVLSWKLMEYLPFRRLDLQPNGSWKAIRWPLPGGESRDIPDDAVIHTSAIQRMREDRGYRPGNLIIGGGGRVKKRAPERYGTGEWVVKEAEGDEVCGTFVRDLRAKP